MSHPFFKPQDDNEQSPIPVVTDEEVRRAVVRVSRDLNEIKTALVGNQLGTPGIVPRLDAVEKQSGSNEKLLAVLAGVLVLFATCVTFISDLRHFLFHP